METRPVLHVLGGCHVNGHPNGPEDSFVAYALAGAPTPCDLRTLAPASFRKIDNYLDDPANPIEGSVVILQMGNHESMKGSWRGAAGGAGENASSGPARAPVIARVARTLTGSLSGRIAGISTVLRRVLVPRWVEDQIKLHTFRRREAKGHVFFDREEFAERIEGTFARLSARHPARVIVLTALRAASPEINICRRRVNRELALAAERHGFEVCDAYYLLDVAANAWRRDLFSDPMHLNRAGHDVLASALRIPLAQALTAVAEQPEAWPVSLRG